MVKYNKLRSQSLTFTPYSSILASSYYWHFAHLEAMLQRNKFGTNDEVIADTEAYFESEGKMASKS